MCATIIGTPAFNTLYNLSLPVKQYRVFSRKGCRIQRKESETIPLQNLSRSESSVLSCALGPRLRWPWLKLDFVFCVDFSVDLDNVFWIIIPAER